MKTVYLVRHGESEANISPLRLTEDSGLTERGRIQAETVADRVSRLSVDVIISSTMPRAKETAEIIKKRIIKPIDYSDLFVERRFPSSLRGKPKSNSEALRYDKELFDCMHDPNWRFEDAETFAELNERTHRALAYLEQRPEGHILVATHGMFMRILLGRVFFGDTFTGPDCLPFI